MTRSVSYGPSITMSMGSNILHDVTDPVSLQDAATKNYVDTAASGGGTTELDYVERTTDLGVTATSSASANSVIDGNAVSFNGTTRVKIEVGIARADFTNNCFVTLWDGSTDLGNIAVCGTAGAFAPTAPLYGARFLTPSNASHTFHIKAWKTSGTTNIYGAIANALPVWYRITVA